MKKLLVLLFVAITFKTYAQSIDGYINNAQGSTVNLSFDKTYLGVESETITAETHDGSFSFDLHKKKEFLATLSYNSQTYSLFLTPDDTLHLVFTADLMNITMKLSGKGAAENLFLKKFNKKFADDFTDTVVNNEILTTGVDVFEINLYNNHKKELDFFKSDSSFSSFSPGFKNYFTNLLDYQYWGCLLAYPIVRANASRTILKVDELPATLLEGFSKLKVNNADALICDSYRSFLKYYIIYFTSKQNSFNKFTDYNLSMERKNAFAQTTLSETPYQYWLSKFMLDDYEKAQPSTIKNLYTFLLQGKESDYASFIKATLGAYMEKKDVAKNTLANTSAANEADYKIVNGKGKLVKFSDYKGKVIYVDFWASWCGPCRQEMPHSMELHHQFTEKQLKNMIFMYISIDNNQAAWKKAVEDIGMQGIQAWSAAEWTDGAGSYFSVNSIPRYMLIDKTGRIVDGNAKRPSDPAVYDDILKLLE